MSGLGIRSFWKCSIALFFERKMRDFPNRSFDLLLFLKERLLFSSLFLKVRKTNRSFCRSFWKSNCFLVALLKRAIAYSLFCKEHRKERLLIYSFAKSKKRAIAHSLFLKEQMSKQSLSCSFEKSSNERWANERLPNPVGLSIHSFWKWTITLLFEQKISNLENR